MMEVARCVAATQFMNLIAAAEAMQSPGLQVAQYAQHCKSRNP